MFFSIDLVRFDFKVLIQFINSKAFHKANEERKEVHQELVDTRSLLNMIKEKNEMVKEKNEMLAKNEKNGITYRVVGDIVSSNGTQQLLSLRKTPSLLSKESNVMGSSSVTLISHQPSSKLNQLPSIYTSYNNANHVSDSRLSEHGGIGGGRKRIV